MGFFFFVLVEEKDIESYWNCCQLIFPIADNSVAVLNKPAFFFSTEKVREIQEKLEAFIEALHKEK